MKKLMVIALSCVTLFASFNAMACDKKCHCNCKSSQTEVKK